MKWIILLLGVLSNTSASLLIKMAMSEVTVPRDVSGFLGMMSNLHLIFGLALYGMAFLFYSLALINLPLTVAHPILTGGSVALVTLASVLVFGETLTLINILGLIFIIFGVVALTHS